MPSNAVRSVDSAWGGSRTSPSSCDPPDRFTHPTCGSSVYAVAGAERPNTGHTLLNMLWLRQPRRGSEMANSCLCRNFLRRCGTNVTEFNRWRVLDSTDGRAPASSAGPGGRRPTPSPQDLHVNRGQSVRVRAASPVAAGQTRRPGTATRRQEMRIPLELRWIIAAAGPARDGRALAGAFRHRRGGEGPTGR